MMHGGGRLQTVIWGAMICLLGGSLHAAPVARSRIIAPVFSKPVVVRLEGDKLRLARTYMDRARHEYSVFETPVTVTSGRVSPGVSRESVEEIYRSKSQPELEVFARHRNQALHWLPVNIADSANYRLGPRPLRGRDTSY